MGRDIEGDLDLARQLHPQRPDHLLGGGESGARAEQAEQWIGRRRIVHPIKVVPKTVTGRRFARDKCVDRALGLIEQAAGHDVREDGVPALGKRVQLVL